MRHFITSIAALVAFTVTVAACGDDADMPGPDGAMGEVGSSGPSGGDAMPCTVVAENGVTTISCPDGTTATVVSPADGMSGADGVDGVDGDAGVGGVNCSVVDNFDGTSTIACEDGTTGTLLSPNLTPVAFGFTGLPELYTVPLGVSALHIVALGASGGDTLKAATDEPVVGGFGASVDAVVPVTPGQAIRVVVGEQPALQPAGDDGCGASGGGGSFVALGWSTALVVAGGGGGATGSWTSAETDGAGVDASTGEDGKWGGSMNSGQSGRSGGGGTSGSSTGAAGGGGFLGDGENGRYDGAGRGGLAFVNGAVGGARSELSACGAASAGGFGGGGGGGATVGSGGGGYSGGGSGGDGWGGGGGGGSFDVTGAGTIEIRTTHGHGSVTITPQ